MKSWRLRGANIVAHENHEDCCISDGFSPSLESRVMRLTLPQVPDCFSASCLVRSTQGEM